jgi:hypothetical protein
MSTVNVNYSITNLPQVDRHVNDSLKTPLVSHDQNTERAANDATRRTMMPVEVTQSEQQITDPRERKRMALKQGKRRSKDNSTTKDKNRQQKNRNNGFFIDIEG